MKRRLGIYCLGVAVTLAVWLMTPAMAQQSPSERNGVPIDWSSHHVVFSNPGTEEDAIRNGTHEK